jgi:ferredoxin
LKELHALLQEANEADRSAALLWLCFYPEVLRTLEREDAEHYYQLKGAWRLEDHLAASHAFLYGHRYWNEVLAAIVENNCDGSDLVTQTRQLIAKLPHSPAELIGIAVVGLMARRQLGAAALQAANAITSTGPDVASRMKQRATDHKPGMMARLKGEKASIRVLFDENKTDAWFPIIATQEITTAAEADKRPWHEADARCNPGMGPIPVDCKSGSCGTCWVGILAGNENLEPMSDFERKRIAYFGYHDNPFIDPSDHKPLIRLACQAVVKGSVSIVIPPWNGVFGESRRKRETAR